MPGKNKYPLLGAHVPDGPQEWVRAEAKRRGISLADMLAEVIEHYRGLRVAAVILEDKMSPDEIADYLELFAAKGAPAGSLSAASQAAAGYLDRPGVQGACYAFDTARLDWEAHGKPWQAVADSSRALADALRATQ